MNTADDTPFFLIGNSIVADFVNTLAQRENQPLELLPDWNAVVAWAVATGTIDARHVASLRRAGSARWHTRAVQLRATLRDALEQFSRVGTMSAATLAAINDELGATPLVARLQQKNDSVLLSLAPQEINPAALLALIARHAAELFASVDHHRVRRCSGQSCVLWFHDTSKNNARRWCSMEGCGNRSKVSTHYHRHKA